MTQARLVGENEASIPGNGRLDQSFLKNSELNPNQDGGDDLMRQVGRLKAANDALKDEIEWQKKTLQLQPRDLAIFPGARSSNYFTASPV
jgi:hypothetical protein